MSNNDTIYEEMGGKEYVKEVANTIIQQMGGRKLCAMVGAKNFTYGAIEYAGFYQPYMILKLHFLLKHFSEF